MSHHYCLNSKSLRKEDKLVSDGHVYVPKSSFSNDGMGNTEPIAIKTFAIFQELTQMGDVKILVLRDTRPNSSLVSGSKVLNRGDLEKWRRATWWERLRHDFTQPTLARSSVVTGESREGVFALQLDINSKGGSVGTVGTVKRRPMIVPKPEPSSQPVLKAE